MSKIKVTVDGVTYVKGEEIECWEAVRDGVWFRGDLLWTLDERGNVRFGRNPVPISGNPLDGPHPFYRATACRLKPEPLPMGPELRRWMFEHPMREVRDECDLRMRWNPTRFLWEVHLGYWDICMGLLADMKESAAYFRPVKGDWDDE
jgi:hypothetical protein